MKTSTKMNFKIILMYRKMFISNKLIFIWNNMLVKQYLLDWEIFSIRKPSCKLLSNLKTE